MQRELETTRLVLTCCACVHLSPSYVLTFQISKPTPSLSLLSRPSPSCDNMLVTNAPVTPLYVDTCAVILLAGSLVCRVVCALLCSTRPTDRPHCFVYTLVCCRSHLFSRVHHQHSLLRLNRHNRLQLDIDACFLILVLNASTKVDSVTHV